MILENVSVTLELEFYIHVKSDFESPATLLGYKVVKMMDRRIDG